jgi:hypothetical protein
MTKISDRELLKALGYGEDHPKRLNDALEATVCLFKLKERASRGALAHN